MECGVGGGVSRERCVLQRGIWRYWLSGSLLAVLLVSLLAACGGSGSKSGKPLVLTSFYPLWYFTSEIAGDRVEVRNLVPTGAEPHDWEPTPKDMTQIQQAALFVYNGAGFEAWVPKALGATPNNRRIVVEATNGLSLAAAVPGEGLSQDPHVWLDPVLAKAVATAIAAGLTQADPAGKATYDQRLANLLGRLDTLDQQFRSGLATCERREIITSHAAFGYLAQRYQLQQIAVKGLAPDEEPTPARLAEVTQIARQHHATTIFVETLVNPAVSKTIASEVGATTLTLDPLEGVQDVQQETYFTVMAENLQHLRTGLGCK